MARTERTRWSYDPDVGRTVLDRHGRDSEHINKRCPEAWGFGCDWCITGGYKRIGRRKARHDAKAMLRRTPEDA